MLLSLYVTTNCNLRCSYCYVNKSEQKDMDEGCIEPVIKFIEKMLTINNDDEVVINFFGGETLLRRKFIEDFIEKIEKQIKVKIKYFMTTNGTLLTKENVDFLKENMFSLSISVDGTPKIHDQERKFPDGKGSWEIIQKNLKYTLDKFPNAMARITFNSQTYKGLEESIEFLIREGFRMIKAIPDYFDCRWDEQEVETLKGVLLRIRKMYKEKWKSGGIILSLFDNELKNCGDCTGGYHEFSIDVHGNIFPCTYSVEFPEFKIGNVIQENTYEVPQYHIKEEERKSCKGCKYFKCCISGKCLFMNYKMSGKFYEPNGFFCAYQKMLYHFLISEG